MKHYILCICSLLLFSCKGDPASEAMRDIKKLESSKNLAASDSMINSYVRFADGFPEHDSAVVFLFNAAHICIKSNKVAKGARLYERIALEYKGNPFAPEALIRGGTAFASIPDPANAKRLYDMFIQNYPQHKRIGEVRVWSETSGMSEEQLFRYFKSEILQEDSSQ